MLSDVAMADDILLQVLALIDVKEVLGLLATSSSTVRRLLEPGDGRISTVQRLVVIHFGQVQEVMMAIFAACQVVKAGADSQCWPWCEGPVVALRVLACTSSSAQALRQATILAALGSKAPGAFGVTCEFLRLLCKSKLRQRRVEGGKHTSVAAAEAALSAVLATEPGVEILHATAAAMTETELELDRLVESGDIKGIHSGYKAINQRRSAVDLLRHHYEASGTKWESARNTLDAATDALDLTIRGYMEEGYELAQDAFDFLPPPNLVLVPYDRQWVFDDSNFHVF